MKRSLSLALVMVLLMGYFLPAFMPAEGATDYDIRVESESQYVEIIEQIYGGKVKWTVVGDLAAHLRALVYENWDTNGDGAIDLYEASQYFKKGIEPILEGSDDPEWRVIGTINVTRADPMNDNDQSGVLYDADDVAGLIGDVNSTGPIEIRLLFRGRKEMDGAVYPYKLALIPFLAAYRGNITRLNDDRLLKGLTVKCIHKEIGVTFDPYSEWDRSHTMVIRLIIGEFLFYDNTITEDISVPFRRTNFVPMESPFVLFIVLLVGNSIANRMEYRYFRRNISRGLIAKRRKQLGRIMFAGKIALLLLYLMNSFSSVVISGSTFVLLTAIYAGGVTAMASELYGHRGGEVRRTKVARGTEDIVVEDVYLITRNGILLHHATRRLHPEVDEDILSSMLIAIQDFVKDVFKDEKDFELKKLNFGDKEIYIERGRNLVLAAVLAGKMTQRIENRIKRVLSEIEEGYGHILEDWDGNVEAFRGVGEILRKIWSEEEDYQE